MSRAEEIHKQLRELDTERRATNAQFLQRARVLREELEAPAALAPSLQPSDLEPPPATDEIGFHPSALRAAPVLAPPAPAVEAPGGPETIGFHPSALRAVPAVPPPADPELVDTVPDTIGFHPSARRRVVETATNQPAESAASEGSETE